MKIEATEQEKARAFEWLRQKALLEEGDEPYLAQQFAAIMLQEIADLKAATRPEARLTEPWKACHRECQMAGLCMREGACLVAGIPDEVQEWIWHMDLHLTEHDLQHAGKALRAAWPQVRAYFMRRLGGPNSESNAVRKDGRDGD
jgi:hypothetical protein